MRRIILLATLLLALNGCAGDGARFAPGTRAAANFERDQANCRNAALQFDGAFDQQVDRYDNGSTGQMIGAGIGASIAEKIKKKKHYNNCMHERGYARADK